MDAATGRLTARAHIQNFSAASQLEPHWGYADRVIPCVVDAGSCEYLDAVYGGHDIGMLYMGIFWSSVLGILLVWAVARRCFDAASSSPSSSTTASPESQTVPRDSSLTRLRNTIAGFARRSFLPNAPVSIFGHTTRLQVLVLGILTAYLAILTFAGITYKTWITPVKNQPPGVNNTRTSLGPWSDRIGTIAYALTPLSILLASRESLLSVLTGVPYTSFLFLHRWTGYLILVQSILHTIGWIVIEAKLYQPQPAVWDGFVQSEYIIWGFVALGLLILLWFFSLGWTIRNITGYEFFRKVHYVLAMVYIGAAIGHWEALQCFLVPGLVLWACDRLARLVRMGMLHYGHVGPEDGRGKWQFKAAQAESKIWTDSKHGDVVRLDFGHRQAPWKIGQHFFLCFSDSTIWQSHPFTPLSVPEADGKGEVRHSYIFRAKGGETRKVAGLLKQQLDQGKEGKTTLSVIMQGPYGESIVGRVSAGDTNILAVAGGTGITYVLPVLLSAARARQGNVGQGSKIELAWAVKREQDLEWVRPELDELRMLGHVKIRVFVTDHDGGHLPEAEEKKPAEGDKEASAVGIRGSSLSSSSSDEASEVEGTARPDVNALVKQFVEDVALGRTVVFGSGPPGMVGNLRGAVASCNSGSRVWKGEERFDVELVCDDRLEW
ncbi:Ferric reductase like transmembrane component domain containing protein [Rhypophila decipiens]